MTKTCMRIHSTKKSGETMRPGTPTPDMHWSWMLAYKYMMQCEGIWIAGSMEQGGGPEVHLSRDFASSYPIEFEHIMKFVKSNDLTVTTDGSECAKCKGNINCVGDQG